MRIANFIFGGSTLASRIGDRIRQKDGLSYGASSSFTASSRDPVAQLMVTVSTNPVNIGKVTSDVQEELDLFLKDGPTDKELADARQAFVEGQKVGRTTDDAIAAQIVSHMDIGRTFAHEAAQEKAILELTPQKVTEAFRKHVDPKKLVIIRAGDFKK
jgi:zinc protease